MTDKRILKTCRITDNLLLVSAKNSFGSQMLPGFVTEVEARVIKEDGQVFKIYRPTGEFNTPIKTMSTVHCEGAYRGNPTAVLRELLLENHFHPKNLKGVKPPTMVPIGKDLWRVVYTLNHDEVVPFRPPPSITYIRARADSVAN
ncbi:MAG: hypothetical protein PHN51_10150 [Candidatus Nanopelagicales bacterium]|nr:hypothetical protein [Candidatus Nanopelagicales bacterium]